MQTENNTMRTKEITRRTQLLCGLGRLLGGFVSLLVIYYVHIVIYFPLGAQVVSGQWGAHVVFHAPSRCRERESSLLTTYWSEST